MNAWRRLAAGVALAVAISTAFAVIGFSMARNTGGFTLVDAMVAPILLVFYLGPALLTMGMALRSRSVTALVVASVIVAFLAAGLEVYGVSPWHFRRWGGFKDYETSFLFAMLLIFWPLTTFGGLLWLALNRRAAPPPAP